MAATQLARQSGAEVYATASPGKWQTLREQGYDEAHLASSRDLGFEAQIEARTGGSGVDVVLNSLAGDFTDASLRLLRPGGRFIEMGKTDRRDPAQVAADHDGVTYQAFDLFEVDPDRLQDMLAELAVLFESGAVHPLPATGWDVRQAPQALRQLSQGRHTGKYVLVFAPAPDPDGTTLITGGTGTLGRILSRHLVTRHGVRHLLLTSRQGAAAAGAPELIAELGALGAQVRIAACDVADPLELAAVLDSIDPRHPLDAVLHAAGVLDDGAFTSLTPAQLDTVGRPKVDGAWNLHRLTAAKDLSAFVLFSSVVSTLGNPGQANYGAANGFLDALAHHRRVRGGLRATSLGWGLWAEASGLTGHLTSTDLRRMSRNGLAAMTTDQALNLFDQAIAAPLAVLVPAGIDTTGLSPAAAAPVLANLLRPAPRRAAAGPGPARSGADGFAGQLIALAPAERQRRLLALVRDTAAAVLGHASSEVIRPDRGFMESEFDSLSAIELRNRLNAATGLTLPTSAVFDYPTPLALAQFLGSLIGEHGDQPGDQPGERPDPAAVLAELTRLDTAFAGFELDPDDRDKAVLRLNSLLQKVIGAGAGTAPGGDDITSRITTATNDEIFDFIENELGIS
jgi:acyl carrier protein